MKRAIALLAVLVLLLGMAAPTHAWGRGGGGGHFHGGFHHGGCCWWGPGAFIGGLALGAALAYPYYPYQYYAYPSYAYPPYQVYAPPVAQPAVAYQQVLVQREVVYPNGKYVLYGDGVSQPWQWVWVPVAPAVPPPIPAATQPVTPQRPRSQRRRAGQRRRPESASFWLQKLLKDKQDKIREQNKEIEEGVFTATADPKEKSVPPPREDVPPFLAFAALQNAADALARSAEHYQKALDKVTKNGGLALSGVSLKAVNAQLLQSERKLTSPDGLPGRPWFRHMIYAPGFYTGYGVKTIPGVREAIEQKKWKEAEEQIVRVAGVLQDEAALIESAAEDMEKAQP